MKFATQISPLLNQFIYLGTNIAENIVKMTVFMRNAWINPEFERPLVLQIYVTSTSKNIIFFTFMIWFLLLYVLDYLVIEGFSLTPVFTVVLTQPPNFELCG